MHLISVLSDRCYLYTSIGKFHHFSVESREGKYLGPDNIVGLEILSAPPKRKHTIDPANPLAKSKHHITLPESQVSSYSSEINDHANRGCRMWGDQYYFVRLCKQSWSYLEKLSGPQQSQFWKDSLESWK